MTVSEYRSQKSLPNLNFFTCGNIFKGDELGAPETGAVAPPVSVARLSGIWATGTATSAVSGIPCS